MSHKILISQNSSGQTTVSSCHFIDVFYMENPVNWGTVLCMLWWNNTMHETVC